ncbi:hypothetical protein L596_000949 [Steinernema carpocapsae]|uniref:Uncharacterized protein n=1 Tax=Steinernema carpocapsae TaxID=34508 RepID=A0A4U8UKC6_STECR|nr:hypothetical protein L596_000949 [Steinernema carpocapsae]
MTDNEESIRQVMDVLTAEKEEYVKNAKARIAALDIGFAEKEASLEKIKKKLADIKLQYEKIDSSRLETEQPTVKKEEHPDQLSE